MKILRALTQRRAAAALTLALLAVPGLPTVANAVLPEPQRDNAGTTDVVDIATDAGNAIVLRPPAGWRISDRGNQAVLRDGDSVVLVRIFDRGDRDPQAVAQRLMRADRVRGISTALDGGTISTADGALSGTTCVAVSENVTGSCAFLADDDVVVSVLALGSPDDPALPIAKLVEPITRDQR